MNIRRNMISEMRQGFKLGLTAVLLAFVFTVISSYSYLQAAPLGSTIDSISCPDATEQAPVGSQIDHLSACTVNISWVPQDDPGQLQIRVTSDTTTKTLGNGGNLTITSPENRLFANDFAVTTAGSPVTVETGMTGNTTLNMKYKTWEADVVETSYNQTFELRLLDTGGTPVTQGWVSVNADFNFTTTDIEEVSVLAAPTVSLTTSNEVFAQNTDYDSNTITVRVKANNTWIMKVKMDRNPKDDSTTEEFPVTQTYFRCETSANYNCLNSSKTQFAVVNTYYNVAENNGGDTTTGTSDNKALDTKDVTVIYTMKTQTTPYIESDYTSNTVFLVQSPPP